MHHKDWLAEVRIREMQVGCTAGCHSQMKAMLGVYEYPLHVYDSDLATFSDYVPFLMPRWGQFSVGYVLGIIFDSPCTRLFNHPVLLISLQNNSILSMLPISTCSGLSHCFLSRLSASSSAFLPFLSTDSKLDLRGRVAYR